jgi:TPR repeat protein
MYLYGDGFVQDYGEALKFLTLAAEEGNAAAMLHLAEMLERGVGVPSDVTGAIIWYTRVAELGGASAQLALGRIFSRGVGIPVDVAAALKWYSAAGASGEGDFSEEEEAVAYIKANGKER